MEEKHLIMGTAGHIDHGKTTLIKALSGFDCDTHKQEKERGITINLGFTHLNITQNKSIGIIDVPGHKDFIDTMIAGACGVDFVLLVVAADEGIMPQTKEHIRILEALGVKQGIIAINKIDAVEEDLLELVRLELEEFIAATFLRNSPIVNVSALKTSGMEKLIEAIENIFESTERKSLSGPFRLFIDRTFTIKGHGTVVTGSVLSGKLSHTDKVFLLPHAKELRIKALQRHGKEVERIIAGDRASLNLSGIKKSEITSGNLLASEIITPSNLIDAELKLFPDSTCLSLWNNVIFLFGTVRQSVRIHLLDKETLRKSETGLVQIYLSEPITAQYNDKFIIRDSTDTYTIGGGKILDEQPLHHKKRHKKDVIELKALATGNDLNIIVHEIRKLNKPVTLEKILAAKKIPGFEFNTPMISDLPADIYCLQNGRNYIFYTAMQKKELERKILKNLKKYHADNPYIPTGMKLKDLSIELDINRNESQILEAILSGLQNKAIKYFQKTWILKKHSAEIDKKVEEKSKVIIKLLNSSNKALNKQDITQKLEIKDEVDEIEKILKYLLFHKKIYNLQGNFITYDFFQTAKQELIKYLENNKKITAGTFRDLINSNRNTAILILNEFDSQNLTVRKADYRVLPSLCREAKLKKS